MVPEWDGLLWSRKRELGNTFRFVIAVCLVAVRPPHASFVTLKKKC